MPEVVTNATTLDSMALTKKKDTLEFVLRQHRIPLDVVRKEHGAGMFMMTKLLGVTPRHCSYLMLWPNGYETMGVLVPNLFNIPACDFGIGSIDGGMRSLTAYVSSRAYGCGYCSAHCSALGTIWMGDSVFLAKNAAAMEETPSPEIFSSQDVAIINFAKKVGRVPCELSSADIQQMEKEFTPKQFEAIVNASTVMGFLNRFMDTIGMTLEREQIDLGMEKLVATGWTVGIAYDEETDAELMADDAAEAAKRADDRKHSGIFSFAKTVLAAKQSNEASLSKIPSSDKDLFELCNKVAGFVPYFLKAKMVHANARASLAWCFVLRLTDGTVEVPAALKQVMCYICATNAKNSILRAHFAFMAHRGGVSIERLIEVTNEANQRVEQNDDKEAAAIELAKAASFTPSDMTPALVDQLSTLFTPAGIIELITTVSVVHMFHRWTSVYAPEEYEPEVGAFLEEHAAALNIKPTQPSPFE